MERLEERVLLEGATFVHPGILNTAADFTRMATKVAAQAEPWLSGWNKLLSSGWAHLGMNPAPVATITRGDINNSYIMWSQIDQTYNSAMIWKVTGDTRYADQAVSFLNAWATVNTSVTGNSNVALALGLYGFQWANVAEIMSTYSGWAQADQTQFQNYLINVFVPGIHNYLGLPPYTQHWGNDPTHYWANWDLCNIGALMAIGVFTDRHDLYDEALNYVYNGVGNGAFDKAIYYLHAGNLGQGQEAGRDQGHATLDFALLGQIAQTAWNQGDDLFSYKNNEILAGVEYLAKYALGNNVPFTTYASTTGGVETQIAGPLGFYRPIFELFYNHYVTMEGLSAPYTTQALMQHTRPEGDYGNGDEYSWGTLIFALDPDTTVHPPQNLVSYQKGTGNIELSWWGGANDTSFNVYRATSVTGPFTQIASGILPTYTSYTDQNRPPGTYYYKVTGVSGATETAATNVVQAASGNPLFSQLSFDESSGTTASDSVGSLTGTLNGGASFVAGGKSGNALSLDGSSGYVSLPAGAISSLADFTIATWVYLNSSQTWARIFDFGDSRGDWMFLTPKSGSGTLQFATGTTYNWNKQSIDAPALATNQWVHLAVTFSNRLATLYVNGIAVGSNAGMDFPPYEINGSMPNSWIGRSQYSSDPYLNGKIDDFRIYRGAMTTAEVYTLATGNPAPAVPGAPTGLTATAVPGNQINLSWPAVSGATGYSVYRATTSGGPYTPAATLVRTTSFSDTGLTAGTTYYYVASASNNGGDGAYSPQASAVALPPIPAVPTGLTAKSVSTSSVALTWTAAADAVNYTILRATVSGGPYTPIASGITASSYNDNGLASGNTYYYVVFSVNAAGNSANSNEAAATLSDLLLRLKFDDGTGPTAADSSGNALNATLFNSPTWGAGKINGAVQLNGTSAYASLPTGLVNGLTAITLAAWVNLDAVATWARIFDFGTGTTVNMFLTPKNGTDNHLRFAITTGGGNAEQRINSSYTFPTATWVHVAVTLSGSLGIMYVNGAEVGRNSSMTLNPSSLGNTTLNYLGKSQYADPYLQGRLDDFRIFARTLSAGEILALATGAVPAAPTSLSATAGAGQVALTWNPVASSTYNVLRSATSGGPYSLVASGLTAASFVDNGLTGNGLTTYYYVVTAANSTGDSALSNEASATPTAVADTWSTLDIGSVGLTGSSTHSGNIFSVQGSGADIWGTADAFRFTYRTMTGDGAIVARVASLNATNAWAKSGVMMRESLAAGAANDFIFVTPGNGVAWQQRLTTGGSTTNGSVAGLIAPYWVKLQRTGNTFNTYSSTNGIVWVLRSTQTISMASTINVGLADTAHDSTLLNATTFDNVAITPAAPTGFTATASLSSHIDLAWTGSMDAQSYTITRATDPAGPYTTIASSVMGVSYTDNTVTAGTSYYYTLTAVNLAGSSASVQAGDTTDPTSVAGRYLRYANSAFDAVSHDNALAPDKAALLPGQTATFANFSSYSRGLDAITLDLVNPAGTLTASDFTFMVGTDGINWSPAPAPASVVTRPNAGANGSVRIEITWPDNAIANQWLQVTLKGGAGSTSGLPANDVFYFGNAIGETGNSATDARVTIADVLATRANATGAASPTNAYDFNRDGVVDAADVGVAATHQTAFSDALAVISPPPPSLAGAAGTAAAIHSIIVPLESRLDLSAGPRQMEYLDRGVVATRSSSTAVFVSWRSLATDAAGTGFNVYRSANGGTATRLNSTPLTGGTNYTDTTATLSASNKYFVKPVINGVEQSASGSYTLAANSAVGPLVSIPLRYIGDYSVTHMSVGDLDGDGEYDFVVDRIPNVAGLTEKIEAYKRDGTFLWAIDCGPNSLNLDNIEPGSSAIDTGNWDGVTVYDLDGDGKAEVLYRSANGVVFGDGSTLSYSANNNVQFISVINGVSGAERARIQVPTDYLSDGPMGAMMGVGYLDGVHPSLVVKMKNRVGSGPFNLMMLAYDFNGTSITQKWVWKRGSLNAPDGHNIRIVDVDQDGKDEVGEIGYVLNGDGTLKYNLASQGIVHGDRWFIGDFDPDRPGLEGYGIQQDNPSMLMEYYYDAATGRILHTVYGTSVADAARGIVGDVDPGYRGFEYWSFSGIRNSGTPVVGQDPVQTYLSANYPWPNFSIWWDGDVLSESLNNTHIDKWNPATQAVSRVSTLYHYGSPTAAAREAPIFYGDITGDWREEVIFENSDHRALDIYTTQSASSTRLYSLAQDPEYRNCLTTKGYLQSNELDYYLGDGMSAPPTPNIQVHAPPSGANAAPTVATAATASATTIAATSVNVSVLGADDGGEPGLVYTWWATGGQAPVTFSAGGTNAAKNDTAAFTAAGVYPLIVAIRDGGGKTITSTVTVTVITGILGRYLRYANSIFDAVSHDNALASGKTALLPGQTASFANYSSYSRGLNAVSLDLVNPAGTLTVSDFTFMVGADGINWSPAAAPTSVIARPNAGANGSVRIEITWPDNVIAMQWLQVTLKGGAGSTSGLPADDVFCFGNAIGETGDGVADAKVTIADVLATRANATGTASPANVYDFNRDGVVDPNDQAIAAANQTSQFNALTLPSLAAAPVAPAATSSAELPAIPAASGTILEALTTTAPQPRTDEHAAPTAPVRAPLRLPTLAAVPRVAIRSDLRKVKVTPRVALHGLNALRLAIDSRHADGRPDALS